MGSTSITLLLGNSINKEREISSTLRLKEIESQEVSLAKQIEFYIELIDKLVALNKDYEQVDELLSSLYGKLYIQASPKIISGFIEIVNTINANEDNQRAVDEIRMEVDKLISTIRYQLVQDRRRVACLYRS